MCPDKLTIFGNFLRVGQLRKIWIYIKACFIDPLRKGKQIYISFYKNNYNWLGKKIENDFSPQST